MKISKARLRQIIKEERQKILRENKSYAESMDLVNKILEITSKLGPSQDQIDALLDIVGNDDNFETEEARSAILSLEDRDGSTSIADVENYIRDALRAQMV